MDAQVLNLCASFVSAEDSGSLYLRIPRDTMVLQVQRVEEESKGTSTVKRKKSEEERSGTQLRKIHIFLFLPMWPLLEVSIPAILHNWTLKLEFADRAALPKENKNPTWTFPIWQKVQNFLWGWNCREICPTYNEVVMYISFFFFLRLKMRERNERAA